MVLRNRFTKWSDSMNYEDSAKALQNEFRNIGMNEPELGGNIEMGNLGLDFAEDAGELVGPASDLIDVAAVEASAISATSVLSAIAVPVGNVTGIILQLASGSLSVDQIMRQEGGPYADTGMGFWYAMGGDLMSDKEREEERIRQRNEVIEDVKMDLKLKKCYFYNYEKWWDAEILDVDFYDEEDFSTMIYKVQYRINRNHYVQTTTADAARLWLKSTPPPGYKDPYFIDHYISNNADEDWVGNDDYTKQYTDYGEKLPEDEYMEEGNILKTRKGLYVIVQFPGLEGSPAQNIFLEDVATLFNADGKEAVRDYNGNYWQIDDGYVQVYDDKDTFIQKKNEILGIELADVPYADVFRPDVVEKTAEIGLIDSPLEDLNDQTLFLINKSGIIFYFDMLNDRISIYFEQTRRRLVEEEEEGEDTAEANAITGFQKAVYAGLGVGFEKYTGWMSSVGSYISVKATDVWNYIEPIWNYRYSPLNPGRGAPRMVEYGGEMIRATEAQALWEAWKTKFLIGGASVGAVLAAFLLYYYRNEIAYYGGKGWDYLVQTLTEGKDLSGKVLAPVSSLVEQTAGISIRFAGKTNKVIQDPKKALDEVQNALAQLPKITTDAVKTAVDVLVETLKASYYAAKKPISDIAGSVGSSLFLIGALGAIAFAISR